MDCFVASAFALRASADKSLLAMTSNLIPAAQIASGSLTAPPSKAEGAGNAGCTPHPLPCVQTKRRTQANTGTPKSTGTPCAMALRLTPCSPWSTGLVSLHRLADHLEQGLIPASGDQDHTA